MHFPFFFPYAQRLYISLLLQYNKSCCLCSTLPLIFVSFYLFKKRASHGSFKTTKDFYRQPSPRALINQDAKHLFGIVDVSLSCQKTDIENSASSPKRTHLQLGRGGDRSLQSYSSRKASSLSCFRYQEQVLMCPQILKLEAAVSRQSRNLHWGRSVVFHGTFVQYTERGCR